MKLRTSAKINLSLAVLGRRKDSYHEIDSLVGFLDFADELHIESAQTSGLSIAGRQVPTGEENLALRALRALQSHGVGDYHLHLHKRVFVCAGLGGGSANAAGVLRGLGGDLPVRHLQEIALNLGADVPMCLFGKPARVTGIGEIIRPCVDFSVGHVVLIVPPQTLSTAAVFAAWDDLGAPKTPTQWFEPAQPAGWRNDLETPAIRLYPRLREILTAVRCGEGVIYGGMSGSGGCCFVLCNDRAAQQAVERRLRRDFPDCFLKTACLLKAKDHVC